MSSYYTNFRKKLLKGDNPSAEEISLAVEEYAVDKEMTLIKTTSFFFEKYKFDYSRAKTYLSRTLTDKIRLEAQKLNLLDRGVKVDSVMDFMK